MKIRVALAVLLVAMLLAGHSIAQQKPAPSQTAKVTVTDKGFEPATVTLKPNVPAQITFLRQTDNTCATEVIFPEFKINKPLPLNKAVVVDLTPTKSGKFGFACGMNMERGTLVVEAK